MNEYTYDSTTISLYSTESYGDVTVLNVSDDYGSIGDAPTNLETESNLSNDSYGEVSISADNYPFGTATISGGTPKVSFSHGNFVADGTAYLASTALEGIRQIWVGTGSLFEMGGGMERSSAFWVGSGGLTVSGTCEVTTTLDWNELLFVPFTTEDLGAVDAVPSLLDFGGILDPKDEGEESWGFVYNTDDVRGATSYHKFSNAPWAEFNTYSFTTDRTGSGGLFAASGLSETKTSTEFGDKTTLFSVTGGEIYSQTSREVMSGNASFGSAVVEKFVHEFNDESGYTLQTEDNGLVWYGFSETEDLGTTTKPVTAGEYDNGGIIWNNVEANTGTYEFVALYDIQGDGTYARYWEGEGSITISGQDLTTNAPHWTASGSLFSAGGAAECRTDTIVGSDTTLFTWSGEYSNLKFQYHWTGSGSLSHAGGVAILRTYGYDDTATIGYSTDNWGEITDSPVDSENWGLVTEGWLSENWWYIWHDGVATSMGGLTIKTDPKVINDSTPENYFDPTNPGLSATEGHNFDTYSFTWGHGFVQEGGSLFGMGGAAEAVGYQPVEDIALFTYSGAYNNLQATFREIGSGAISRVGGGSEYVIFSYNDSTVVPFSSEDIGLITGEDPTVDDYGTVHPPQDGGEYDYGLVVYSATANSAQGTFTFSLTRESWTQEEIDELNPEYTTKPYGTFPYAGDEKTQEESKDVRFIPVWGQIGKGSLFSVGGAAEAITVVPNTTGIFQIVGGNYYLGSMIERLVVREIGTGAMSRVGGAADSVTFDYNESSIVTFSSSDDGLITDSATTSEYGGVALPQEEEIDYGSVIYNETVYPVSGILQSSGTSPSAAVYRDPTQGGSLFSAGGASECVSTTELGDATTLFDIYTAPQFIGNTYKFVWNAPPGTGGLFSVGGGVEKVTFDYNESSTIPYGTEDSGLIVDSVTVVDDYGSVIESQYGGEYDQGQIIFTSTAIPFGSLNLSLTRARWTQAEIDELSPGYTTKPYGTFPYAGDEKTQEESGDVKYKPIWGQIGEGSLFSVGGASESATYQPTEDTALFDIFTAPQFIGNTYRFCWNYDGSGNLPLVNGAAESVTFDYNESSINVFSTDDEGNIVDNATVFGEYGDLNIQEGEDDYGTVIWTSTIYPLTGTLQTSGVGSEYVVFRDPTTGGSLFSAGGSVESKTSTEFGEDTSLGDLSGTSILSRTRDWVGSGSLFTALGAAESATFDYNESSIVTVTSDDYGLIVDAATTNVDQGSVANIQEGEDDYGSVLYTSTTYPTTGLITLTTAPQFVNNTYRFCWNFVSDAGSLFSAGGAAESATVDWESTGLFDVFTAPQFIGNTYKFVWNAPPGTGGLFSIGGLVEAVTWNYAPGPVLPFNTTDYGLVTDLTHPTNDVISYGDFGLFDEDTEDYGFVIYTSETVSNSGTYTLSLTRALWTQEEIDALNPEYLTEPFGTFPQVGDEKTQEEAGDVQYAPSFAQIGSGSLFTAGGAAESAVYQPTEDTVLFTAFTAPQFYGNTYRFIWNAPPGTGGLFSVGGCVESRAYVYNETGIVLYSTVDYGNITVNVPLTPNNPDVIDQGAVALPQSDGEVDYGSVLYTSTAYPTTGTYTASGAVSQSFSKGLYTGGGSLFATSGAGECVSTTEFGEDTSLGDLSGSGLQARTVVEIGSGSIFRAGGAAECRTYDYDQNSIVVFTSTDHGLVVDSVVTSDDQGSVDTIQSGGEYDYGTVLYSANAIPLTGTYVVDGSVSTAFVFGNFTGSGSLFTASGGAESSTYSPENDTALFDIFTAPAFVGNTYCFIWNAPDGSGGLFSVGGCVEVRTYAYNESASQAFSTEDNGLISDAVTTIDDHGDFGYVGDDTEDHGQVWLGATNGGAANGFITFGGEVFEIFKPAFAHIGEGSLFTTNGAAECVTTTEFGEDTSLGDLSGTHSIARTFSEVGTGSIFTVVGGAESRTYNYDINLTAITFQDDNGLVTDSATTIDDQGTVHPPQDGGEYDYGSIWIGLGSQLWRADDTVSASGSVHLGLIGDTVGIARTFGHIASGSLFATGGAAEVVVYDYEDTTLYDIFTAPQFIGNTYAFCWSYTGTGNINSLGGCAESRTWHYSDTLPSVLVVDDEGNIVDATTVFADYGNLGVTFGGEEDYGSNNTLAHPGLAASGTYTISGVASTPFVWRGGCEGGTYLVSGEGIERPTTALTGEGTVYIYTAPASVGNTYAFTWGHGFVQSGSLFSAGGAAESTTTNPPEDTLLYTVAGTRISERQTFAETASGSITLSGAAVERQTDGWIGSGSVTLSGTKVEAFARAPYVGSGSLFTAGGASEVVAVLEVGIGLFDYVGSAIEKHTERWIGSGSATLSGTGVEVYSRGTVVGSGTVTLSGTKAESFTPATEIGSGSLFTTSGAAESVTVDWESTGLFNVIGSTHYNFSLRHIGAGSLYTSSGAAESTTTNPPENTALFAVGGTKAESFTPATHVGSGSTTLSGVGSENYTGAFEGSGTATITGEADLIYRIRFFGSGSLFTGSGAAESATTNPPESTSLHQIGGTRVEKAVFREIGSGSVTLSGTSSNRYIPHITGSGSIYVSGEVQFKVRYILGGSGNISTFGGAAEAVGTNPPEDIALFVWSGISENQWSPSWVAKDGKYILSGEIPEPLITKHWTVSGSLFSVGGAAESFSANIDGIGLYDISGAVSDLKATVREIGSGSLFTAAGASESIGTNPPESTVLLAPTGTATERHTENWVGSGSSTLSGAIPEPLITKAWTGSGSISLSGTAVEKQTDDWVGSGSLFTAGGSAESTTTNPPENTILYTWTGAGTEKHTERWIGSGSTSLSGAGVGFYTPHITGSGSLFTALGSAESISTSEVSTGIFTVSGDSADSRARIFTGSGSITISGTKAESFTPAPEVGVGTLTFTGEAFIRWIPSWIGSGTATIFGQVTDVRITRDWIGSGSLFTAGGSAEAISTNPPESTLLYTAAGNATESTTTVIIPGSGTVTFSGEARDIFTPNNIGSGTATVFGTSVERQTDHYHGSGTATISGNSGDVRARAFEGSGSLFTASGAAESTTVDYEDTTLYDIFGHGAEAFVRKGYVGSGSLGNIGGTVTNVKLTHSDPPGDVDYVVSGEVTDIKRTFGYVAPHGTLFAFGGGVESATVDYENILLTTIGGSADDKFVRAAYIAEGTITLSGESLNELRTFEPPFMFATII